MTKAVELHQLWSQLESVGITFADAQALRRISMTLHRWHELECGDSNHYRAWGITRGARPCQHGPTKPGAKLPRVFVHDDDGTPFLEVQQYGTQRTCITYEAIPDREAGAKKRLARIMKAYPDLIAYIQTDPRGCALYILRLSDIPEGTTIDCYYSRGIAVHR